MSKRLSNWTVVCTALMALFVGILMPREAWAGAENPRHSVVYLEAGMYLDGQWSGLPELDADGNLVLDDDGNPSFVWYCGSAFFVGDEGEDPQYLLTANHVIEDYEFYGSGKNIELPGGTVVKSVLRIYYDRDDYEEAYVVASDSVKDISLLRLDRPTSKRDALPIGQPVDGGNVRCIGFPSSADNQYAGSVTRYGENDATVTTGTISRLFTQSGSGVRSIQTDAVMNNGNSGGPMVDEGGNVIGINDWVIRNENLYYAIDMSMAVPLLNQHNVSYATASSKKDSAAKKGDEAPTTTEASIAVVWDDADDQDGSRPATVTATLSNGDVVTLAASNSWTQSVKNLPREGEDGAEISYAWTVSDVDGYETSQTTAGTATTLTAKHEPIVEEKPSNTLPIVAGVAAAVVLVGIAAFFVMRGRKQKALDAARAAEAARAQEAARAADAARAEEARRADAARAEEARRAEAARAAASRQSAQRQANDTGFRLVGVSGALEGKRYMIPVASRVTIGRADTCGVIVPQGTAGVSSKHCEVWVENGQAYVCDLGSTYGTFAEPGIRLSPGQPYALNDGQAFWTGDRNESFQIIEKRG